MFDCDTLTGIHCCGSTDWAAVIAAGLRRVVHAARLRPGLRRRGAESIPPARVAGWRGARCPPTSRWGRRSIATGRACRRSGAVWPRAAATPCCCGPRRSSRPPAGLAGYQVSQSARVFQLVNATSPVPRRARQASRSFGFRSEPEAGPASLDCPVMTEPEVTQRVEELRSSLRAWGAAYYDRDEPLVPDATYDEALTRAPVARGSVPASPQRRLAHPADRWDGAIPFAPVEHAVPMMSLDNAFDEEQLRAWAKRNEVEQIDLACELKFDGLAVSLRYEDGVLVRGATRGDGTGRRGRDRQRRRRRRHPQERSDPERRGSSRSGVRSTCRSRSSRPSTSTSSRRARRPYVNPRNTAAGSLRQKDATVTASRGLTHVVLPARPRSTVSRCLDRHSGTLELLSDLGFPVNPVSPRSAGRWTRWSPTATGGRSNATTSTTRSTAWS